MTITPEWHTTTLTARKFFILAQPHPLPPSIATMERAVNHDPLDFDTRMACADAYEEEGWSELAAIHRARATALKGRFTYWRLAFEGLDNNPFLHMVVPRGLKKRFAAMMDLRPIVNSVRVQSCTRLSHCVVGVVLRGGGLFLCHPDRKQKEFTEMPRRQRLIEAALETLYLIERLESSAPGQTMPIRFPSQIHMIGTMP